jgi:hypothetical protein
MNKEMRKKKEEDKKHLKMKRKISFPIVTTKRKCKYLNRPSILD